MPAQPPASPPKLRSRAIATVRYSVAVVLLAATYQIEGRLGLSLASVHPSVTAIWPPSGIAMGILALFGSRLWPGVWAGAFLVNYNLNGELVSSLGIACGNTAETLLGVWFLGRLGGSRAFESASRLMGFLGGCGLLSCGLAATLGVASISLLGPTETGPIGLTWLTWWIGDCMSIWILVPFMVLGRDILVSLRARRISIRPARLLEAVGAALFLLVGALLAFGDLLPAPYSEMPLAFATLPPLFWIAMRFGPFGTSSALVLQSGVAIWGTLRGYGQYADAPNSYLLLQAYLAIRIFFFQLLAVLVTSRDRAVTQWREAEQRIAGIVKSVPGLVWETWGDPGSPGNKVTYVSEFSEHLLGYPTEYWITRPDFLKTVVHPEDKERLVRETRATYTGKGTGISEFRFITKEGKTVDVEARYAVIRDINGEPVGLRGFTMDISERLRAEKQLQIVEEQLMQAQKMEAVGRLAGGIAHDFNNLLTSINGYSELILDVAPGQEPVSDYAREIRTAGGKAADLTHQLLTFSRQDIYQPQVFDLNDLVAEQKWRLATILGEGVNLSFAQEPASLKVREDPDHIERILSNLVRNARDAMLRGGTITVETSFHEEKAAGGGFFLEPGRGPYVVLSVSDTGSGMPPEVMAHLFEPFFTTKGRTRAMGLGLSTIYGILKRNGGGIRVESKVGKGSRFEIYLRAHAAEKSTTEAKRSGTGGLVLEG